MKHHPCTWRGCKAEGTHVLHENGTGLAFARLCDEHNLQLQTACGGTDPKKSISAIKLAKNKTITE